MPARAKTLTISEEQLKEIIRESVRESVREAVHSEFENAGLSIEESEHRQEARKDFTFLRAWRQRQDKLANAIGNAILAVVGLLTVAILGLGARAMGLRWPE